MRFHRIALRVTRGIFPGVPLAFYPGEFEGFLPGCFSDVALEFLLEFLSGFLLIYFPRSFSVRDFLWRSPRVSTGFLLELRVFIDFLRGFFQSSSFNFRELFFKVFPGISAGDP